MTPVFALAERGPSGPRETTCCRRPCRASFSLRRTSVRLLHRRTITAESGALCWVSGEPAAEFSPPSPSIRQQEHHA